jgi:hypothetical protein
MAAPVHCDIDEENFLFLTIPLFFGIFFPVLAVFVFRNTDSRDFWNWQNNFLFCAGCYLLVGITNNLVTKFFNGRGFIDFPRIDDFKK